MDMATATATNSGDNDSVQNQNPLLISEIAAKILDYLGASGSRADLEAAFDVCPLWGSLVEAANIRHRSTSARAPVLIEGDMSDRDNGGKKYLAFIKKHPSLKATKFTFRNTKLESQPVLELLAQNGAEMEELELHYDNFKRNVRALDKLLTKAPNLKTLTITNALAILPWLVLHSVTPPIPASLPVLGLTKIKINFSSAFDNDNEWAAQEKLACFCCTLLAATPRLEELEINDTEYSASNPINGCFIAATMVRLMRRAGNGTGNVLAQLRLLVLDHADPRWLNCLGLDNTEARPLLHTFALSNSGIHPTDDLNIFGGFLHVHSTLVERFMAQQAESLTYLELPLNGLRPTILTLPPMPNLVQLKLQHQGNADEIVFLGVLNYALTFPRLKVLGLGRELKNFVADEIYPDPDDLVGPSPPATSVQVLQQIPVGVDAALMARIGRLFPSLSRIRVRIPYEREELLVSIWEFCPNVMELFLTFDPDARRCAEAGIGEGGPNQGTNAMRRGLDSLFSGIPEAECERLRGLPRGKLALAIADFGNLNLNDAHGALSKRSPSLLNLTKLARLVIDVDTEGDHTPRCRGHQSHHDTGTQARATGRTKLSDVFAYATLAAASQLALFQVCIDRTHGVMVIPSPETINHVCSRVGMVMKCAWTESGEHLRLIRPGTGLLESLGSKPISMDW